MIKKESKNVSRLKRHARIRKNLSGPNKKTTTSKKYLLIFTVLVFFNVNTFLIHLLF